jgi:hypothetical protein
VVCKTREGFRLVIPYFCAYNDAVMRSAAPDLAVAIVEGMHSLTQLLRQTKIIAAKLDLKEVEQWVGLELTGYAADVELPGYRKVLTQSLEIYNSHREHWQYAGRLNYGLKVGEPIAEIEKLSQCDRIDCPVAKNFSIKNDFGDSFGSDWPQRFIVSGSEYKRVLEAVAERWTDELEVRGLRVCDPEKFTAFLDAL